MKTNNIHLLIVEDNPLDVRLVTELLKNSSNAYFTITHTDRIETALMKIFQERIEAILLDLNLPDSQEFTGLDKILGLYPGIPIIVLTGMADENLGVMAVQKGAEDYLIKGTINTELLVRSIRYAIERKKAEEALRLSEEKFTKLFHGNASPTSLASLRDRRIIEVNRRWQDAFGFSSNEIVGTSIGTDVEVWDRTEEMERVFRDLEENGSIKNRECEFVRKSGDRWTALLSAEVISIQGEMVVLSSLVDITERKMTEKALQESLEIFRQITENSQDIYWLMTGDLKALLYLSPAFETIWGRPAAEAYGNPLSWLEQVHQGDRGRVRESLGETMINGMDLEFRIVSAGGTERWIWARTFPIIDEAGSVQRVLGVARDITERKLVEEQLLTMQKIESIGVLAGGMAHDFNNLLTSILGNIYLAKLEVPKESRIHEYLEDSEESCLKARELSQRLIVFARGGIPVKKSIRIDEAFFKSADPPANEHVTMRYDIPGDIGLVEVDDDQIRQVFRNMVQNSIEAMPGGGDITIRARNASIGTDTPLPLKKGDYIIISIEDTGTGIPRENLAKIFDPYFTSEELSSKKGKGLGLAICHSIVSKHGGHIAVDSTVGVGTQFRIYLPAA